MSTPLSAGSPTVVVVVLQIAKGDVGWESGAGMGARAQYAWSSVPLRTWGGSNDKVCMGAYLDGHQLPPALLLTCAVVVVVPPPATVHAIVDRFTTVVVTAVLYCCCQMVAAGLLGASNSRWVCAWALTWAVRQCAGGR